MARTETYKLHAAPFMIAVVPLGWALSLFAAISYSLCVLFYVLFPAQFANHAVLSLFLPAINVLTLPGFFAGLISSFICGWYVALVFGPLYNFFVARSR
jgi:hypothetical protein